MADEKKTQEITVVVDVKVQAGSFSQLTFVRKTLKFEDGKLIDVLDAKEQIARFEEVIN